MNFDGLVRSRLPLTEGNPEFRQGIENIGFPFHTSEKNGLSPDDHVREVASGKGGGYSGKEFFEQLSTLASSISASIPSIGSERGRTPKVTASFHIAS